MRPSLTSCPQVRLPHVMSSVAGNTPTDRHFALQQEWHEAYRPQAICDGASAQ